jgi:hypothetical protein
MARAQKARWANARKESQPAVVAGSIHKKNHTMSALARRKIGAAQRARWANTSGEQESCVESTEPATSTETRFLKPMLPGADAIETTTHKALG